MKHSTLLTSSFLLLTSLTASALTVAEKGKTTRVSVPENPSEVAAHAAAEFKLFAERITGGTVEIVTNAPAEVVLNDRAKDVPEQGFRIKVEKRGGGGGEGEERTNSTLRLGLRTSTSPSLSISSGPDAGLLYGVYEVLERFGGCRWFTSWMERVPAAEKLVVPDGYADSQKPDFLMRGPFWWDVNNHPDFAARLRVNGEWSAPKAKHGGAPYRFAAGIGGHSFNILCPVKEYGAKHPDWFTKDKDGNSMGAAGRYCQLCLTNPELTHFIITNMAAKLRSDPGKKLIGLMQNDNFRCCGCPACSAIAEEEGSQSGPIVRFVNTVAAALEKEFPDIKVVTFAYQYSRHPPKKTKPRKNVMVELCSVECDFQSPIDQSFSPRNQAFLKDLEGWASMTEALYVWDYSAVFNNYFMPCPNVLSLQGNYRLFRKNKVKYLFEQGAYTSPKGNFAELKAYLQAKLMWNADADVEALMQDFFAGYYGKGAPYVRTYFDALHRYFQNTRVERCGIYNQMATSSFPDDFFDRAETLWDLAEQAVRDEPEKIRKNVRNGAFDVWYAQYERAGGSKGKAAWLMEDPSRLLARQARRAVWAKRMMEVKRDFGIVLHPAEGHTYKPDVFFTELAAVETNGFPAVTATPGNRRAQIEETYMDGMASQKVDDQKALDGRAMRLDAVNSEWAGNLSLTNLAVDEGKPYRLRLRIRVELRPGADPKQEAFAAGVYDSELLRPVDGGKKYTIADVADGEYHWYDFMKKPWKGVVGGYQWIWIQPGMFNHALKHNPWIEAIYVDCLEIERID